MLLHESLEKKNIYIYIYIYICIYISEIWIIDVDSTCQSLHQVNEKLQSHFVVVEEPVLWTS